MRKDWHGIMKVLEVKHWRNGKVIWETNNLYNMLHDLGEQFFLQALFANDGTVLPSAYYLGLDARSSIDATDTIDDLVDEPTINGYLRQQLSVENGWSIEQVTSGGFTAYRAIGNIITFSAVGGDWGPVENLFLTNASDDSGVLIASTSLGESSTVLSGDSISMRMTLSLRDYPSS